MLMIMGGLASPVSAVLTEQITSNTISTPAYILDYHRLDGDPTTLRNGLKTEVKLHFYRSSIDADYRSKYRVAYSLRRDTVLVKLSGAPKLAPYVLYSEDIVVPEGSTTGVYNPTITIYPDPATVLSNQQAYRVDTSLQYWDGSGWENVSGGSLPATTASAYEYVHHFTQSASGDADYNIRPVVKGLLWDRKFVVDGPNQGAFEATIQTEFARFDDWAEAPANTSATITFDVDLIEKSTGRSVALQNDGITTIPWNAQSYDNSDPADLAPSFKTINQSLSFKPAEQLKSATEEYILKCTVRHTENATPPIREDATLERAETHLMHFNGKLVFGDILTQFDRVSNSPGYGTVSGVTVASSINVWSGHGTLPSNPNYVFGGRLVGVDLYDDGHAKVTSGAEFAYKASSPPSPSPPPVTSNSGRIDLTYGSVSLSKDGVFAESVKVHLPQGNIYIPDQTVDSMRGEPVVELKESQELTSSLQLQNNLTIEFGPHARMVDESHPLVFGVKRVTLDTSGTLSYAYNGSVDVHYIHEAAYAQLQTDAANGDIISKDENDLVLDDRASNDLYWRTVNEITSGDIQVNAGGDGTSRMTVQMGLGADNDYQTHFPLYAHIKNQGVGSILLDGGYIATAVSALSNVSLIALPYYQTCANAPCGDGVPPQMVYMEPNSNELRITPTGGVYQMGSINEKQALKWGARGDGAGNISVDYPYAHRTDQFDGGYFFAAGYHLYASENPLLKHDVYLSGGGDNSAATLLLAGVEDVESGKPQMNYPTQLDYIAGKGYYSGLNFISIENDNEGASRIGGNTKDYTYRLMPEKSKYYARNSGVFGRQVAEDGSFDSSLSVYKYDFTLTSFQQTFKASSQADSWINGAIRVEGYCDFSQQFLGLTLNCVGELEDADLDPADKEGKNMPYWNSEFRGLALKFEKEQISPDGVCPVMFNGYLTMGIETRVAHINTPLYGVFAFNSNDGNLLTQTTGAAIGIDGELNLPVNIKIDGPAKDYTLVPTGKLRFSNPASPDAPNSGFVTFGATINVPYFKDFQVQVMTSANNTPAAPLYLTPGWQSDGKTFFNHTAFDPDHVSWPQGGAISFAEYKSPNENTHPSYLIKAEQDLFGVIPLSYPMKWNDTTRSFASMKPEKDDLFIINVDHQVDYLDAGTAKVSFGAQYDGLPKISLANMLNGQIDKAAESVSGALSAPLKDAIDQAFKEFDKLLADSLDDLVDPVVDSVGETVLVDLYRAAHTAYDKTTIDGDDWSVFEDKLNKMIASQLYNESDLNQVTEIRTKLRQLSQNGEDAASLTKDLKVAIERVIIGIDCISNKVKLADGTVPQFTVDPETLTGTVSNGLLTKVNGERQIVQSLVQLLLKNLVSPELASVLTPLINDASSDLNAELNAQLLELDPSLVQITEALQEVRAFLIDVHTQVENAEGVIQDFNEVVNQALDSATTFQSLMERPASMALAFFKDIARDNGIQGSVILANRTSIFDEITEDQFVDLVKTEIKDALIQSDMIQQFKFLMRQMLYDVQNKMEQTVSTVLSEITGVMKKLISKTAGKLDEQITPMLGKVNEYLGAADVVGFATFNGDSLRKLRMDASLQMKVPDEMKLNVFMEINAYNSEDAAGGCLTAGEKAVEVTIGAMDVSCGWISEGLRADLTTKMSLKDEGSGMYPNGLAGGFVLTGGEIDFQSFKITEFGATLAVGGDACYLGAKAHGIFNAYELGLGVFFGRTCSVDPLLLVDEQVGSLFKPEMMPLTGAYVYGEVWLPISELALGIPSSCMFSISAGVGTGIGFFLDDNLDPTFVAKMYAGVSGEALCVVSIKGDISMVGVVQDGSFSASGKGRLKGKAGACPFCVKFSTTATVSYSNGDWDVDY